jgi:hypothetical protein
MRIQHPGSRQRDQVQALTGTIASGSIGRAGERSTLIVQVPICGSRVATDPWPSGPLDSRLHESQGSGREASPWLGAPSARRFNWCTSRVPPARPATTAAPDGFNRERNRTASSKADRRGSCSPSAPNQLRRRRDGSQADHTGRRGSSCPRARTRPGRESGQDHARQLAAPFVFSHSARNFSRSV